jgi:hypothetical protein
MKLALAIVCSFLLAGTPLFSAPLSVPCAKKAGAGCPCGGKMTCCQSGPASDSQPASATPAPAGSQSQLLLFAPGILAWTLPANPADLISSTTTLTSPAPGAPLYALNCVRLI